MTLNDMIPSLKKQIINSRIFFPVDGFFLLFFLIYPEKGAIFPKTERQRAACNPDLSWAGHENRLPIGI